MSIPNGTEILKVFQYVQQIFRECQQLIIKLDSLMAPDWSPLYGNRITRDVTSSLYDPNRWLVEAIFRIYESKDQKINKGITISFWSDYKIEEPVITVGELIYSDLNQRQHWDLWKVWFEDEAEPLEKRTLDGSVLEFSPKDYGYIKTAKVFSLPLVEIQNDKDVENKIYKRLIG